VLRGRYIPSRSSPVFSSALLKICDCVSQLIVTLHAELEQNATLGFSATYLKRLYDDAKQG
jgi:hypothetical protein